MADYKDTLNLPYTKFPMRANLPKNEPKMIEFWTEVQAYEKMTASRQGSERFVLHDGPPYANGHIHLGTAMNKILKDIIIKSKNLARIKAEYIPGWDCHGLPIEHKVEQEKGGRKNGLSTIEIRKNCREYALNYLDIQRSEFKRLGVLGNWNNPYLTMDPAYEATTAYELARFMQKGSVFRKKKPVHWCFSCETALAEAEVEYQEKTSPSIFIRFSMLNKGIASKFPNLSKEEVFIVIWTTTPWTIPSNLAVAVHPEYNYVLVRYDNELYILAEKLLPECLARFNWSEYEIVTRVWGTELEGLWARHPLYSRDVPIVLADYVTLETGTGCVHTAPGHGQEDYETGLKYNLDILSPVDNNGRFLSDVEDFQGLNVFEANPKIIKKLKDMNSLLSHEEVNHSYPHCWRCKNPVIFRATTQWFISMQENELRNKALNAIENQVVWIPPWGKQRIKNMIAQRPEWCISRQRSWGVPIIALLCENCSEAYYPSEWVNSIVDKFANYPTGADYWFETPLEEILPEGLTCPHCGNQSWRKESDILDVWFDSGTSFAAVLEQRPECSFPADMYLEGSDQHRGWFHSSLLAAVGTRDQAPYRSVLTHGFVVDAHSRKMSKSIGNVIAPQDIIDKYGAEILRMWVASENYREDMRISEKILRQLVDNYRRIRNTCRYILGNLYDFNLEQHEVHVQDMFPLDRYAYHIVIQKHKRMQQDYLEYELHKVFHTLHNVCVNDLSSFYLDILKDRLYVSAPESIERRSAQTSLLKILYLLIQDMTPILSFTAEEVYQHLPDKLKQDSKTVFGLEYIPPEKEVMDKQEEELWDLIYTVRNEVTKAIEPERKSKAVGHSLDTLVTIYAEQSLLEKLNEVASCLREIFIVSKVDLQPLSSAPENIYQSEEVEGLAISVSHAPGEKCPRCWNFDEELGKDPNFPEVCPRCAQVLQHVSRA